MIFHGSKYLVDLDRAVELCQLLLQQLQVGVDEPQLEGHRLLGLGVGGGAVEVLGAVPQPQLLVDLHVELGPLGLQFAATCRRPRVRALQQPHMYYL